MPRFWFRLTLFWVLLGVARTHHFFRLVVLAALGLAGLWMVHTLAQDFNAIQAQQQQQFHSFVGAHQGPYKREAIGGPRGHIGGPRGHNRGHTEDPRGHNRGHVGGPRGHIGGHIEDPRGHIEDPRGHIGGHIEDPRGHIGGHIEDPRGHIGGHLEDPRGHIEDPRGHIGGHIEEPRGHIGGHIEDPRGHIGGHIEDPRGHIEDPRGHIGGPNMGHVGGPRGHIEDPRGHIGGPNRGHIEDPRGPKLDVIYVPDLETTPKTTLGSETRGPKTVTLKPGTPKTETLTTRTRPKIGIDWERVLSRDPVGCARSFLCQLAASEERGADEELMLRLVSMASPNEGWAVEELQGSMRKGEELRSPSECMKLYRFCPYSSGVMMRLIKFFGRSS